MLNCAPLNHPVLHPLCCINLYCISLYVSPCIVSPCIISPSIVLYCIVSPCIILPFIVLYCITLYCISLYCLALYCIAIVYQMLKDISININHSIPPTPGVLRPTVPLSIQGKVTKQKKDQSDYSATPTECV